MKSMLLCTDLDRTLIPNGVQPEYPSARGRFANFCSLPEVTLAYVTGRDITLLEEAIVEFRLPVPDYAITDVGSKIYRNSNGSWSELCEWETEIGKAWKKVSREEIAASLSGIAGLKLQEDSKQNTHKVSFYADLGCATADFYLKAAESALRPLQIDSSLIWSIDETRHQGLLDILPSNATKLHAIEFLHCLLGLDADRLMFAGDSGNDLPVLISPIPSVLVANATEDVRSQAKRMAEANGCRSRLFLAKNDSEHLGNYAAGILQGVGHYFPESREMLKEWGAFYD
ncbi:HAD-IIB family hydrolase [Thiomicrorhabdus sp.]|uniref:HAD-IIB family hydrolase n=1 Tax=Thiomicrorhabdus sp. TaxID=2039724 RepID=UPI0029C910F1|nr:HAD-IIB family hydrolase [Thiomicrorhabdus sp.]